MIYSTPVPGEEKKRDWIKYFFFLNFGDNKGKYTCVFASTKLNHEETFI